MGEPDSNVLLQLVWLTYGPLDAGIQVSNTPGAVDHGTATVALFLILSAMRNLWKAQLQLHAGVFKDGTSPAYQHDPEGKTLLIVGMGGIGRVSISGRRRSRGRN